MKSSSISVSNAMLLSVKEWAAAILVAGAVTGVVYFGWDSWERFEPGPDHRETCWAELQSDYWAWMRWCRVARERHDVLLVGDSVVWGQEVPNDQTISHYINKFLGDEIIANLGNDGLHMAGIGGIVSHYGDYLGDTKVILQFNPLWVSNDSRDLHGAKKSRYHHPRLIPQLDPRITYYHDLNTRLGYLAEHYFRVFPFVRHIMANYFDNTSISTWIMDHPYDNPFAAITFQAAPVMAESQGKSLDWETKEIKIADYPFVDLAESIQFECFLHAIDKLKSMNTQVFVMLGPFNDHFLTPESRERLLATIESAKTFLNERGVPYFDTIAIGLPSKTFGDSCHLLRDGHEMLGRAFASDPVFREWLAGTWR